MKNPLSALPALLIIATGLYACSGASKSREAQLETTQEKIENVKVTTLSSRMVGNTLEFPANTRAYERVNLGPVSPGRIEKFTLRWATVSKRTIAYSNGSDRVASGTHSDRQF